MGNQSAGHYKSNIDIKDTNGSIFFILYLKCSKRLQHCR